MTEIKPPTPTWGRAVVLPDRELLARSVASRFLNTLLDLTNLHGSVNVVISGGSINTEVLPAVAADPLCGAIDWSRVHIWWVDERFVEVDSPDRNDAQAIDALFAALPQVDLHPMAAFDPLSSLSLDEQLELGRLNYIGELKHLDPVFHLALLGMGEDGHIASLFPGHSSLDSQDLVISEGASPKMPPHRLSLGPRVIEAIDQIWMVTAGASKAQPLAKIRVGAKPADLPAGLAAKPTTLWLMDLPAASM
ncbi:MAG: 6-phosphogluconolactonase [Actinomycetaceae bacterium]|nr:6-phosphogluconolactonase [Actinomycetaceae bacterium]